MQTKFSRQVGCNRATSQLCVLQLCNFATARIRTDPCASRPLDIVKANNEDYHAPIVDSISSVDYTQAPHNGYRRGIDTQAIAIINHHRGLPWPGSRPLNNPNVTAHARALQRERRVFCSELLFRCQINPAPHVEFVSHMILCALICRLFRASLISFRDLECAGEAKSRT